MKVELARIDERLVHGQVIASWTRVLGIEKILVIDDSLATDSFMSEVLKMAAPSGVDILVLTAEQARDKLLDDKSSDKVMLLFKNIKSALKLVKAGYELKELDIGNIGSGANRKAYNKRVFMSDEELDIAEELINMNVHVYTQMLHTDSKEDFKRK